MSTSAREGTTTLTRLIKKGVAPSGSLRIFGDWFGRPHDNVHRPVDGELVDARLTVCFDGGERLTVWQPDGVMVTPDSLLIDSASRVRWEWFSYGQPQTPQNLCVLEYWVDDARIRTSSTGEKYRRSPQASIDLPAIELT